MGCGVSRIEEGDQAANVGGQTHWKYNPLLNINKNSNNNNNVQVPTKPEERGSEEDYSPNRKSVSAHAKHVVGVMKHEIMKLKGYDHHSDHHHRKSSYAKEEMIIAEGEGEGEGEGDQTRKYGHVDHINIDSQDKQFSDHQDEQEEEIDIDIDRDDHLQFPGSPSFREYCISDSDHSFQSNDNENVDGAKITNNSQMEGSPNQDKGSESLGGKKKRRRIKGMLSRGKRKSSSNSSSCYIPNYQSSPENNYVQKLVGN